MIMMKYDLLLLLTSKNGQLFYFNANKRHSVFSTSDNITMLVFCMKFDEKLFEKLIEQYRFG